MAEVSKPILLTTAVAEADLSFVGPVADPGGRHQQRSQSSGEQHHEWAAPGFCGHSAGHRPAQ